MQALSQLSYTPSRRQPNYVLAFRPGMQISLQPVKLAEWTGLEPATPGVTGRYSNRLNYHSALDLHRHLPALRPSQTLRRGIWRPHGDSNPGYRRERAVS